MSDDRKIDQRIAKLISLNLSYDELIRRTAQSEDWADFLEGVTEQQRLLLLRFEEELGAIELWLRTKQAVEEELTQLREQKILVSNKRHFLEGALHGRAAEKKIRGAKGAEALHSRPGGNRDKQKQIRELWASGKYSSREICAEQECAALGMSFSSARKALRGTPQPT